MSGLPPWVWVNGEFRRGEDRVISPFDRGLTGGDALYETLLGFLGEPQHFDDHWRRLTNSAEALNTSSQTVWAGSSTGSWAR